jgi:hypothetical protein
LVLLDGKNGRRTILDPGRLFGPVVTIEGDQVTMPELAAAEFQNQTTARSQAVELRQAEHSPHPTLALPRRTPRRETAVPPPISNLPSFTSDSSTPLLPSNAPWSLLQQQWQGNGLPLGMGSNGLLIADPET